jgi:hypothetical protein
MWEADPAYRGRWTKLLDHEFKAPSDHPSQLVLSASTGGEPRPPGAGTELTETFQAMGVPSCQACKALARKMDANGTGWCRANLDEIVAEIEARAAGLKWWEKLGLGARLAAAGRPLTIRGNVLDAIRRAEEREVERPAGGG